LSVSTREKGYAPVTKLWTNQLTYNPNVEDSNTATGIGGERERERERDWQLKLNYQTKKIELKNNEQFAKKLCFTQ
jgi:hypothetical protein